MNDRKTRMDPLLPGRERSAGEHSEPKRSERPGNNGARPTPGESPGVGTRPDPEVCEKPQRRRFTQAYKERIVREAEACTAQGQIGALLRREGLYSSMLSRWRQQYAEGGRRALADDKRGRKPTREPHQAELDALRKENARLQHKLMQAETIIEVQKKLARTLELDAQSDNNENTR